MGQRKERLTVTVDRDLIEAAAEAVTEGRAESVSAWVNRALAEQAAKERRLEAMREALAMHEAECGEITDEEMQETLRRDRANAIVVGGPKSSSEDRDRGRGAA